MTRALRVLIVEDREDDALLLLRALRQGGYDPVWKRVDTAESMREALLETWDVILSDHAMPHFSSSEALALIQGMELDVPFLIVSGSIPEDLAVSAMKAGAHDFLTKGKLARLVPAIEREIREGASRSLRRRAERELRESEERYRRFFEEDLTGAVLTTPEGRILDANPAFLAMFGFATREEALATDAAQLHARPDDRAALVDALRAAGRVGAHERAMRRRDGKPLHVIANVVGEVDPAGSLVRIRAYLFDVTRRKELESQFLHAQKLEALGRLAGGVAHDFNNLLTVINGYGEMAFQQMKEGDPVRRLVAQIRDAGERAAHLTKQLLAFSRKQVLQPEVLDLNEVLMGIEPMVRRLVGESVDVRLLLGPEPLHVMADRGQVDQILMNLVVNARDAMATGGSLTIQASAPPPEGPRPDADVPDGPWAVLAIADTGTGMTPDTLAHLFEPFFTTKERGKGTGLGLATVHSIVTQGGGLIRVQSRVGTGTVFRVYLPRLGAEARQGRSPAEGGAVGGSETILLVDDDAALRRMASDVLRGAGYTVLDARDGDAAFRAFADHRRPVDLLLTDVGLPGADGRTVAEFMRELSPNTRTLYISGHDDEELARKGLDLSTAPFLRKPFLPTDLLRKVREVLGAGARDGDRAEAEGPP
jgi:PAS domain S-box-containing protein